MVRQARTAWLSLSVLGLAFVMFCVLSFVLKCLLSIATIRRFADLSF